MILEAFAERPQPAIEGRFKVIAGGNVAAADEPQSVGQGMGRGKTSDANPLEESEE